MKRLVKILLPILIIIGWEAISVFLIKNEFILPRVESVVFILMHPLQDILGCGSLAKSAVISIKRVLIGFCIAALVAVPLGIGMGWSEKIHDFFYSIVELLRPVPPIAWIPLALAWFKIGLTSIAFIIFIGAFFPILLDTIHGVNGIRRTWVESAYTLGANERLILYKVVIPGAAPTIWTGLRVGFGIAWMCVVAAEMLPGTTSGLGYLIMYSYNWGMVDTIIAGMITIGLIGLAMDLVFRAVETRKFKWRRLV